jgi:hypothetical protein
MNHEFEESQADNKLEGRYANYFKVGYNAFEFVIEFGQSYNADEEAQIHTRIVTSPVYAKTLSETLQASLAQYADYYGVIYKTNEKQNRK